MPARRALTAREVSALSREGVPWVAPSLDLQIRPQGTRSWLFRYNRDGRNQRIGLGALAGKPLSEACDEAGVLRIAVRRGAGPLAESSSSTRPGSQGARPPPSPSALRATSAPQGPAGRTTGASARDTWTGRRRASVERQGCLQPARRCPEDRCGRRATQRPAGCGRRSWRRCRTRPCRGSLRCRDRWQWGIPGRR